MILKEIISQLEHLAPKSYQESYDNSGLIVGDIEQSVSGAIICLDSTEEVVEEAIKKGVNLIIAHHPIVFKGLKSFTGRNYVERTIIKAIKNDIAIYAIHTNLDNVRNGVNEKIAKLLEIQNRKILSPKPSLLNKLIFFCPEEAASSVKENIFKAGGGTIGNYEYCSFSVKGQGSFKPTKGANPTQGSIGELIEQRELRVEILVEDRILTEVIQSMKNAHPYEEVAYEIYKISNSHQNVGSGMVGELTSAMSLEALLQIVADTFNTGAIKYTPIDREVRRVAVCGGSGSFLLKSAIAAKADVFITSDFKYHEFFDAEKRISIMDIGHFESEQFTIELIKDFLINKFPKFAAHLTEVNTNPVKYF